MGGYAPETNRANIKRRLIREGVVKNECRVCGLGPWWQGRALVLRLDHVNGDRNDWRRENLALICPNCDSQQPTFAGRNAKRRAGASGMSFGHLTDCHRNDLARVVRPGNSHTSGATR